MFDGVDGVAWRELEYAYSGEADIPGLFRALAATPEQAAEAASELGNELYHQGGFVCSAAVAALPFLLEAGESGRLPRRSDVLHIVRLLAGEARRVAPHLVAPGWGEAWARAVPRLIALLDDGDDGVRRMAALALAETTERADEVAGALLERWAAQDETTRLEIVLAAGELATSLTPATLPETLLWLRDLTCHRDEPVALAATLALARALPGRPVPAGPVIAGLSGDLTAWAAGERLPGGPAALVPAVIGRLDGDVDARQRICLALLTHPDPARRRGAALAAAELLSISTRPVRLLPALRDRLADPDTHTRTLALHLLAAHARHTREDAEVFAAHLDERDERAASWAPRIADVALWGAAWSGDRRCLPRLAACVAAGRPAFPLASAHTGKTGYPLWPPSLPQVLEPCSAWAPELLPVITRRLGPGTDPDLGRALLRTLHAWGPAAAPAVPWLIELLGGRLRHWAADALGAIGPGAAEAGPALRALLRDPGAGLDQPWARGQAAVAVPWAYARVTGDPGPAVRALGPLLGESHIAARRLAGLGSAAAAHVPVLRLLASSREPWTRVEAAHALIRVTGDAAEGVGALFGPIADLLSGRAAPVAQAAATYLADGGDLPAGYRREVRAVLTSGRRHSWDGGWAAIHDDLRLRHTLRGLLGRPPRPRSAG
ncbi:HEAT repeat domain-containing protein [Bailinhaonella thermotolerans]|uniref:HEAT repeat domain-containing protein n=1 Tax=Bailinhaonella thermotolerans TaxID=1070861 RepID=A0A3A4BJP3_9ACTN|nr:HEAT repeat domain-containing protein [Bailinhaonella thermotolerans]RJL35484.1 HEAT repeat domain-containing protein [Bailinhaonella thermotolerans]